MSLKSLKHVDQKEVDAVKAYLKLALELVTILSDTFKG